MNLVGGGSGIEDFADFAGEGCGSKRLGEKLGVGIENAVVDDGVLGVGFQFTWGKIGDEEEKKKIGQGYGSAATGAESCRKAGLDAGGGGQAKEAGEAQENYRRVARVER